MQQAAIRVTQTRYLLCAQLENTQKVEIVSSRGVQGGIMHVTTIARFFLSGRFMHCVPPLEPWRRLKAREKLPLP